MWMPRSVFFLFVICSLSGCGKFDIFGSAIGSAALNSGSFSYPVSKIAYVNASGSISIPSLTPTYTGTRTMTYSISPSLPAGLSFDTSTGSISGAPSADSPAAPNYTTYTVTGTNDLSESSTDTIDLLITQGFVVDDTGDGSDTSVADTVCLAASGGCTLRAAVEESIDEGGVRVIFIPDGTYSLGSTVTVTTGSVTNLILSGESRSGVIVTGGGTVRPFDTGSGALAMDLLNFTVQSGQATGDGGGLRYQANGLLTVDNVYFYKNTTTSANTGALAVTNSGATAVIKNSRFEQNQSASRGGAFGYVGATAGSSISYSEFVDNISGHDGGSIWGGISVDHTTFSGNTSPSLGGAIYIPATATGNYIFADNLFSSNSSAEGAGIHFNSTTATIRASTFYGNTSSGDGGGFHVAGAGSSVTLENVTLFQNLANAYGGAFSVNSGTVALNHVTAVSNRADANSSGGETGGVFFNLGGTVTVSDSVFSGNLADATAGNCVNANVTTSSDYNVYDSAGGNCWVDAANDQGVADVGISSSLATNNGYAPTLALVAGSVAIDNRPAACTLATDARGVSRPQGGACDSGAFESQ
ncbi:MAG: hypothetical protein CL678_03980 [Bdellovibrionaceae bacterium]|nr:hypothetical protein [Pseudobdellovibrionaceae bacterium]